MRVPICSGKRICNDEISRVGSSPWRRPRRGRTPASSRNRTRSTTYLHLSAALVAILLAPAAFAESSIRFLNPDGLFKPGTFSQIAIAKGGTIVFISGQTARDEQANIVGAGDVKKQAEKAFENLRIAVEAAGGSMGDIARITTYVVGLRPEDRLWIGEMVKKQFPKPPAHTLVGISALAAPELLIEIEAVVALDK